MPYAMSKAAFDEVVQDALRELPSAFAKAVAEMAIEVRDWPTRRMLREAGLEEDELLLGLYSGVPLTERGAEPPSRLPDRIYIFRGPVEEVSESRDEAVENIRVTVLHEIGHFFGMDEDDLDRLGYG
jgi:predicted Zn-dependent protease with MMP-like domain